MLHIHLAWANFHWLISHPSCDLFWSHLENFNSWDLNQLSEFLRQLRRFLLFKLDVFGSYNRLPCLLLRRWILYFGYCGGFYGYLAGRERFGRFDWHLLGSGWRSVQEELGRYYLFLVSFSRLLQQSLAFQVAWSSFVEIEAWTKL